MMAKIFSSAAQKKMELTETEMRERAAGVEQVERVESSACTEIRLPVDLQVEMSGAAGWLILGSSRAFGTRT